MVDRFILRILSNNLKELATTSFYPKMSDKNIVLCLLYEYILSLYKIEKALQENIGWYKN